MSTTRSNYDHGTTTDPLPTSLESSNSKLVYLYMSTREEATVTELRSTLDMKQLSLFPVLRTLESEGLVTRTGETVSLVA
ncbi:TrmB family transcriptional regulator [Halalkalicoccus subterraneus]|uniref:TrmB family transcriptional regulator n=1 Tax=Halalkalicoccus subterraneus TaxID=2675002 RepID=UPI000EFCB7A5|nr:TrmB family transcriptional regulator [Halalkalicoccus subterraneus]